MTTSLSPNTKAILLLTAPLIAGRGTVSSELLSPGEYKRLARHLREIQRQPADLVSPDSSEILRACQSVIDESRLQKLLERGFLLSQAVERWQTRAIWVLSRADAGYPRRLKARLREDAPAVIYGCGDKALLETGGIAVVGSRHVDDALIDYTIAVGRLAARSKRTLVSGGAKGIDQAAMRGALEAGGKVCGVLADSLEKTSMNREQRNWLLDDQLVLISPYDPSAGFNVGHAMQRNKLIYALADASLVVSSDVNKGGTWAGAVEQLEKLRFVPVYVRSTGDANPGLNALGKKGALPWPNPQDTDEFESVFDIDSGSTASGSRTDLPLIFDSGRMDVESGRLTEPEHLPAIEELCKPVLSTTDVQIEKPTSKTLESASPVETAHPECLLDIQPSIATTPAEALFAAVRDVILLLLGRPMKDTEVAAALEISNAQAKVWLQRLLEDGVIEKQKRPAGYVVRQSLFPQDFLRNRNE